MNQQTSRIQGRHMTRDVLKAQQETIPFPIVVGASQDWDGIDGPWSSFPIQAGSPPQNLKVLIGTGSFEQIIVLPQGCVASDNSNCGSTRGGLFEVDKSATWQNDTLYSTRAIYNVEAENRLGYNEGGLFGFDNLTLGWQGAGGPSLVNQSIGGIASKKFYLGILGLNPRPKNFTTFNNPTPSLIQNLRSKSLIPSLSWSYTAGNQYRLNQVFGSLVLGGYDESKFVPNNLDWKFDAQDLVDISVNIDSIISTSSQNNMLTKSIKTYMDSSVPHIWLPIEACQLFEAEFGIIWNDALNLYLVNQTQHDLLVARNTSIVFVLSSLTSPGTVNITLPYAAFDLTLNAPLVANPPIRYFPLKRATNSSQYTLGRTFFQEAYLTADYERRNFSVSQCNWDPGAQSKIIAILSPSSVSTINGTTLQPNKPFHLSTGAIVSITVGGAGIFAITGLVFYCLAIKLRRKRQVPSIPQRPLDQEVYPQSAEGYVKAELDGNNFHNDNTKDNIQEMEVDPTLPTPKFAQVAEIDGVVRSTINETYVEADGREIQIYEMPAREEVAKEIGDSTR